MFQSEGGNRNECKTREEEKKEKEKIPQHTHNINVTRVVVGSIAQKGKRSNNKGLYDTG